MFVGFEFVIFWLIVNVLIYCVYLFMGDVVGSSKGVVFGDERGFIDVFVFFGRFLELEGDLLWLVVSGGVIFVYDFVDWSCGVCCDKL